MSGERTGRERAVGSFGVYAEGHVVDDAGCVVDTYQVNVASAGLASSPGTWPLYLPVLVKCCKKEDAIDVRETLLLKKPRAFRDAGETLISDPNEARVSREWITDERLNDPVELERARLRDAEANRGSELVGSSRQTTTNKVNSRRTRRHTIDSGNKVWLWCSALRPTNDDQWEQLWPSLDSSYDHYWTVHHPRSFARALGAMIVEQIGPLGALKKLTHNFAGEVTEHASQTVFHGPVTYVEDPYGYVAEATSPLELLLRPLFVKELKYRHQREYRFVVWAEDETDENEMPINVSAAMFETTRVAAMSSPRRDAPNSTPAPTSTATHHATALVAADTAAALGPDPLVDSALAMAADPHKNHRPRPITAEDAPADLDQKTAVYPAVETLRRIVGQADNEPLAAAAAWHAEPYIRLLCAAFQDPIGTIRLTPDNFIVIRVKFPTGTDAYGNIAIGPRGIVRAKIGRGYEFADTTSGRYPSEGWPRIDDVKQTLDQYGLPRRATSLADEAAMRD